MITLLLPLCIHAAQADDVVFSPDRPGVGESTATPGAQHFMVEGGLSAFMGGGSVATGTSGLTGRYGLSDLLELRLGVPDIGVTPAFGLGAIGIGAKVAGAITDDLALSAVPTVAFGLSGGVLPSLSANATYNLSPVGVWANATATGIRGMGLALGGGLSYPVGPGGLYAHAGADVLNRGGAFFGPGGWIALGEAGQIDLGVDLRPIAGILLTNAFVGGSVGF